MKAFNDCHHCGGASKNDQFCTESCEVLQRFEQFRSGKRIFKNMTSSVAERLQKMIEDHPSDMAADISGLTKKTTTYKIKVRKAS